MAISHTVAAPSFMLGSVLGFDKEQVAGGMLAVAGEVPIARQTYYLADNWGEKDLSWGYLARTGLVDVATLAAVPVGGVGLAGRAAYASAGVSTGIGGITGFAGGSSDGERLQGAFRGAAVGLASGRFRFRNERLGMRSGAITGGASVGMNQLDAGRFDAFDITLGAFGGTAGRSAATGVRLGTRNVNEGDLLQFMWTSKAILGAELPFVAVGVASGG